MVVLASAGGNTVPAIARLVQADEDTIRQVIHRFNEMGMASLDPRWAGGRPRLISPDDEQCQAPGLMESWLAGFQGCNDRLGHHV
ncbi:helix-turn-helix domain-containing protein [Pseudosporangium ferrugineum]|uniref:Winged helix-turn helix protein n=1 Tax=Pseudosporangium ferrugineum TaxID=439699 RepID=A0A2T0QXX1_9ACTN|nr:helix-turn-helix domain-containing protein [Pseudosporangium ferrugineum]PRY10872.1 winged helix-turn helix protein [Pseudosporangium ferrugineum]